jgi:uncharacterized protein YecT (DUF1311 family)
VASFRALIVAVAIASPAGAASALQSLEECSAKSSHVEMRACLEGIADASARELRKAEQAVRKSLASWDEDANYVKASRAAFDASVKEFVSFRKRHCDFMGSLAAGGNGQGDLRLSCRYELNSKRVLELQQVLNFPALHVDNPSQ